MRKPRFYHKTLINLKHATMTRSNNRQFKMKPQLTKTKSTEHHHPTKRNSNKHLERKQSLILFICMHLPPSTFVLTTIETSNNMKHFSPAFTLSPTHYPLLQLITPRNFCKTHLIEQFHAFAAQNLHLCRVLDVKLTDDHHIHPTNLSHGTRASNVAL